MTDTLDAKDLDDQGLYKADPSSIKTFTGRVNPLNATVESINIEDIAHALSRMCRYNGHCHGFISVARHSLWVSSHLETQGHDEVVQLTGLLHDSAETYLGDLVRPLKHSEFGAEYLKVEATLESVIAEKFGIPFPFPAEVYEADNYVLNELELHDRRYHYFGDYREDERDFLSAYYMLTGAIEEDAEIERAEENVD